MSILIKDKACTLKFLQNREDNVQKALQWYAGSPHWLKKVLDFGSEFQLFRHFRSGKGRTLMEKWEFLEIFEEFPPNYVKMAQIGGNFVDFL